MKKQFKGILAVLLTLVILASTFAMLNVTAGNELSINNYPALKGYTGSTAPSSDVWSYSVSDYGYESPLTASDAAYAAPTAVWDTDNSIATLNWEAKDGAAKYVINFYLDDALAFSKELTATSYTSVAGEIAAGKIYDVQVVAKTAADQTVAATCVRRFPTYANANSLRVLENFNNADSSIITLENSGNTSITANKTLKLDPANGGATTARGSALKLAVEDTTGKATALVVKVKHPIGTISSINLNFGVSKATTSAVTGASYKAATNKNNWASGDSAGELMFISVADPTKVTTITNRPTTGYTSSPANNDFVATVMGYTDGYYMIIPLSAYSSAVQNDIKAGTFDLLRINLQRGWYEKTAGTPSQAGFQKGTTSVEIEEIALCDDVDKFINELKNGYDYTYAYSEGSANKDLGTIFNSGNGTLESIEAGTGYTLKNTTAAREVIFNARSVASAKYGAQMTFTAPTAGYYELTNAVEVKGNTTESGTLYYRVVKNGSDGNTTVVYPLDGSEWLTATVDSSDLNPVIKPVSPYVELLKNETLSIQAYFDGANSSDSTISVSLGNPTVNVVDRTDNYKGVSTVWNFGNYVPHFIYDGAVNSLQQLYGRWNANPFKVESSVVTDLAFDTYDTNGLVKNTAGDAGYYYYKNDNRTEEMKLRIGGGYGVSFNYYAAQDGSYDVYAAYVAEAKVKYRVVKNGVKVYPVNDNWGIADAGDVVISANVQANVGDVISVQTYSEEATTVNVMPTAPQVTLANIGSYANGADTDTFAPLWERPWKGRDYNGIFTEYEGSVWQFALAELNNAGIKLTPYDADTYDTTTNKLTSSVAAVANSYYKFNDSSLNFYGASCDSGFNGMSLSFVAPTDGYYDLSTGIRLISGDGKVYVRVLKEVGSQSTQLYPSSGWSINNAVAGDTVPFKAFETELAAGDKLTFQLYGRTTDKDASVEVALDSFVVARLNTKFITSDLYVPEDFLAIEPNYTGDIILGDSRFNYTFTDTEGNVEVITGIDAVASAYTAANGNKFAFADGKVSVAIADGYTASIVFTAPVGGNGYVNIVPATSGAEVRLVTGDEVIVDWGESIDNYNFNFIKDDSYIIEIRGAQSIEFSDFAYQLVDKQKDTAYDAEQTIYFANNSDPYNSEKPDYVGDYLADPDAYWNFRLYDVANKNAVITDHYDSSNRKLSLIGGDGAGYRFTTYKLYGDVTADYGLSLGFKAHRDDTFSFRTGLTLGSITDGAKLYARLIKICEDSTVTTVWPDATDTDGWYETDAYSNKTYTVPYTNFDMFTGEEIRFEVYTTAATTIDLISPTAGNDQVTDIKTADYIAKAYYAGYYSPYKYFAGYSGNYIPMENRWNFELFDASDLDGTTAIIPSFFSIGGNYNEIIHKGDSVWPAYKFGYQLGTSSLTASPAIGKSTDINYGTQMRFVSPLSGLVSFTGAPTAPNLSASGLGIGFRVIHITADGTRKTVWPTDGSAFEKLAGENLSSKLEQVSIELAVGDELIYQLFHYSDDPTVIPALLDANTGRKSGISISPAIITYSEMNSEKISWSAGGGMQADPAFSPYWKVQYSESAKVLNWKNTTSMAWSQYYAGTNYAGFSSAGRYYMANMNGKNDIYTDGVAVCTAFTAPREGTIVMSSSCKTSVYKTENIDYDALVRITVNGQPVYPADGSWLRTGVKAGQVSFGDVSFSVDEGDVVRFEMTSEKLMKSGQQFYINWNPSFQLTKYKKMYLESKDIYNMLTQEMLDYFNNLEARKDFDEDPAEGLATKEAIAKRKAEALKAAQDYVFDEEKGDKDESEAKREPIYQTVIIPGTEGDYREWTEEVYTPGQGYHKVIRKAISTPWWIYLLIALASVAGLAVVAIIVIIILKKKKNQKKTQ